MPLYRYILRRLVLIIPLLIGDHAAGVRHLQRGACRSDHGEPRPEGHVRPQDRRRVPRRMGAGPAGVPSSTWSTCSNLLVGDLGRSIKSRRLVAEDLAAYLPATIELATTAIVIGVTLGISLGLLSALRRNTWLDHGARVVSLFGVSTPVFWLALVALYIFYVQAGLGGRTRPAGRGPGAAAPRHRPLHRGCAARRRLGDLLERVITSGPAGARARQLHHGASSPV
jgi:ABC-type dipeptide/oligopeptide/nickel transport system permease component